MKYFAYILFNFFYHIYYYVLYLYPVKNQILAICTHDKSSDGNIEATISFFESNNNKVDNKVDNKINNRINNKINNKLNVKRILKDDYQFNLHFNHNNPFIVLKKILKFFIFAPYSIARSKIILMDNIFLPFAYTKFKNNQQIVQLWHSSGTIKKFALDSETGKIKELAQKSSSKTTHLIVESEEMIPYFKSAFGVSNDKIYDIGTPRTDFFHDDIYLKNKKKDFNHYLTENFALNNDLKSKKFILYAPTFRDNDFLDKTGFKQVNNDIFDLLEYLSENWIILLRLHPYISKNFNISNLNINDKFKNRIIDVSNYDGLNALLIASDLLITDYSSIIFEYSLLNKPIIFYPYDLKEFEEYSRGFYFNYKTFVPGEIFFNIKEIAIEINEIFNENNVNSNVSNANTNLNTNNNTNNNTNSNTNTNNTNNNYLNSVQKFRDVYMKNSDGNSRKRLFKLLYC
ncbi:MAG: CDP-glycerol glycerophosphotransferase family protein [Methanobrevibacter sp.]|jgi:CDP-ribitol ribitolphosphotransferase|nr:CDP-glycerol glycerophosphotransferase family protein [Candidatus Methanoflexus mossambicus]